MCVHMINQHLHHWIGRWVGAFKTPDWELLCGYEYVLSVFDRYGDAGAVVGVGIGDGGTRTVPGAPPTMVLSVLVSDGAYF